MAKVVTEVLSPIEGEAFAVACSRNQKSDAGAKLLSAEAVASEIKQDGSQKSSSSAACAA